MSTETIAFIVIFVLLDMAFMIAALKTIPVFERGIIYTKGVPTRLAGPGLVFVLPFVQKLEKFKIPLTVTDWDKDSGTVMIDDKIWDARSDDILARGDKVVPVNLTNGQISIHKQA